MRRGIAFAMLSLLLVFYVTSGLAFAQEPVPSSPTPPAQPGPPGIPGPPGPPGPPVFDLYFHLVL